jgi:hypothetical protein
MGKEESHMAHACRLARCGIVALWAISGLALAAQEGSKAVIQQKLEAQFKLTKVTADGMDIVTAGDIVVIHKDDIRLYAVGSRPAIESTYKDGKITQGGFANTMRISMARSNNGNQDVANRLFVAGEKCWMSAIEVRDDGVYMLLYSDVYNDTRYYGVLKIPFNKKSVPPNDEVLKEVAEVVTAQPRDDNGGKSDQAAAPSSAPAPAQSAAQDSNSSVVGKWAMKGAEGETVEFAQDGTFSQMHAGQNYTGTYAVQGNILTVLTLNGQNSNGRTKGRINGDTIFGSNGSVWERQSQPAYAAAPAPPAPAAPSHFQDIAPPPPPPDAPPPTISIGQTRDQVIAAFGQPTRKATIGAKEIYFYKDMKVTFTDGKVSNAE